MEKQNKLSNLRKNLNFKQKDIANKLGITASAYGRWERGECNPRIDKILKLSQILEVNLEYLMDVLNTDK